MALNTFLDFSTTAASNVDVAGIGIQGANAVSNFDNAFRQLMAILRRDLDNGMVFTSKSANYTAVATDNNAFIRFSAAATLSLTAAATLGADWHCWVMADGGAVIIDPNSTETINGATTITIPRLRLLSAAYWPMSGLMLAALVPQARTSAMTAS